MAWISKRSGILVFGVLVCGALGSIAYLVYSSDTLGTPRAAIRNAQERAEELPLKIEPAKLNLGKHTPCEPPLKTTVKITNKSDKPVNIKRIMSSCGCTSAELVGARTLGPGDSRSLNVVIDLTGRGDKSQSVFLTEDGPPIGTVRVDYQIVSPVQTTRDAVDVGPERPTADVHVVRDDGKPVKLLSLIPDIGVITTNADGTQTVVVHMAKADVFAASDEGKQDGSIRRDADGTWASLHMAVVTDYPGCPNASVLVRRER